MRRSLVLGLSLAVALGVFVAAAGFAIGASRSGWRGGTSTDTIAVLATQSGDSATAAAEANRKIVVFATPTGGTGFAFFDTATGKLVGESVFGPRALAPQTIRDVKVVGGTLFVVSDGGPSGLGGPLTVFTFDPKTANPLTQTELQGTFIRQVEAKTK